MLANPKAAKGSRRAVEVSIVAWIDLLGYGAMIRSANYQPLNPLSREALKRIKSFHEIVSSNMHRAFKAFIMNDGAAIFKDLSPRSKSVTYDFVRRCVSLYQDISASETLSGWPGARMIICPGFRVRSSLDNSHVYDRKHASIVKRFKSGKISADQAIEEAWRWSSDANAYLDLQANFAFTKAYVADSSGTAGGLPGPGLYIDNNLINSPAAEVFISDVDVDWHSEKYAMSARFSKVRSIRHRHKVDARFRDAGEVAHILSGASDGEKSYLDSRIRINKRER